MLVRFWGTRGSLPVALTAADVRATVKRALVLSAGEQLNTDAAIEAFIERRLDFPTAHTYGGNSPCIEIVSGVDEFVLCDLGSGVRAFAQRLLEERGRGPFTFNIFLSHVHWDHIMGLPFFVHAFVPGNKNPHFWRTRDHRTSAEKPEFSPVFSGAFRDHGGRISSFHVSGPTKITKSPG